MLRCVVLCFAWFTDPHSHLSCDTIPYIGETVLCCILWHTRTLSLSTPARKTCLMIILAYIVSYVWYGVYGAKPKRGEAAAHTTLAAAYIRHQTSGEKKTRLAIQHRSPGFESSRIESWTVSMELGSCHARWCIVVYRRVCMHTPYKTYLATGGFSTHPLHYIQYFATP
ncbi:hypothetical protein DFP73DRAFT_189787 [Morchella snyderi]|nr:hypothetical protein DFP73DRAFT_189787 [Morchella snyderi]